MKNETLDFENLPNGITCHLSRDNEKHEYIMKNGNHKHVLYIPCTSDERLLAHWSGFKASSAELRAR